MSREVTFIACLKRCGGKYTVYKNEYMCDIFVVFKMNSTPYISDNKHRLAVSEHYAGTQKEVGIRVRTLDMKDGEHVVIPLRYAKTSRFLDNLVQDTQIETQIVSLDIYSWTLPVWFYFCEHYIGQDIVECPSDIEITDFDVELFDASGIEKVVALEERHYLIYGNILEYMHVADYLGDTGMFYKLAKLIADKWMIPTRTKEELTALIQYASTDWVTESRDM